MAVELKMPALSPTMEEGKLARWLVKEGDEIRAGDVLAEIETDKATMEFEAVDEGTMGSILVPEGSEGVKVGTVIALISGEGEDAAPAPEVGVNACLIVRARCGSERAEGRLQGRVVARQRVAGGGTISVRPEGVQGAGIHTAAVPDRLEHAVLTRGQAVVAGLAQPGQGEQVLPVRPAGEAAR